MRPNELATSRGLIALRASAPVPLGVEHGSALLWVGGARAALPDRVRRLGGAGGGCGRIGSRAGPLARRRRALAAPALRAPSRFRSGARRRPRRRSCSVCRTRLAGCPRAKLDGTPAPIRSWLVRRVESPASAIAGVRLRSRRPPEDSVPSRRGWPEWTPGGFGHPGELFGARLRRVATPRPRLCMGVGSA